MSLPHLDAALWVFAALAALCIGVSKAGFAGVGMVSILLMARVLPARESTGAILPMLILADLFAVSAFHRHARGRLVIQLLPPALLGIVAGWLLIPHIPAADFGRLIGWITLSLIALALFQKSAPVAVEFVIRHPLVAWLFGGMAGVTTMLANAAGPFMTIYLLACRLPKMAFVGTSAWFFFTLNVTKVPFSASLGLINFSTLSLNLCLAPFVVAGIFFGKWLLGKVNQALFEWLMIAFSFLAALRLLLA